MAERQHKRRRRAERRAAAETGRSQTGLMSVTIVGAPHSENDNDRTLSFGSTAEMARAAALYGDKVEVVNPLIDWTSEVTADANLPPEVRLCNWLEREHGASFRDVVGNPSATTVQQNAFTLQLVALMPTVEEFVEAVSLVLPLTSEQHEQIKQMYTHRPEWMKLAERERELQHAAVKDLLAGSGHQELWELQQAGILNATKSYLTMEAVRLGDWTEYFAMIKRRLENPHSCLLFDYHAGAIAQSLINRGVVEPATTVIRRSVDAGAGTGLVARLPAFQQATIEEIVLLREDLKEPLGRYRRGVRRLAENLPPQYSKSFEAAIDDTWIYEVAPAIGDIEASLLDHAIVKEWARQAKQDVGKFIAASGALYLGIANFTDLNDLAAVIGSAAVAASPSGLRAVVDSWDSRRDVAGSSDFFYLYESNRRLTRS